MFRLDIHINRVIVVCNNFACIAFTYHILKFGIGNFFIGTTFITGEPEESKDHCYDYI